MQTSLLHLNSFLSLSQLNLGYLLSVPPKEAAGLPFQQPQAQKTTSATGENSDKGRAPSFCRGRGMTMKLRLPSITERAGELRYASRDEQPSAAEGKRHPLSTDSSIYTAVCCSPESPWQSGVGCAASLYLPWPS